jgi:hypothetical protein
MTAITIETAYGLIVWGTIASAVIPLLLAWKLGAKAAGIATAVWAAAWIVGLIVQDPDHPVEGVMIALMFPTLLWIVGLLVGLLLRGRSENTEIAQQL